jgi:hypothetical protein
MTGRRLISPTERPERKNSNDSDEWNEFLVTHCKERRKSEVGAVTTGRNALTYGETRRK